MDVFAALLKKTGLKATSQRLAVHEAMMKLGHASADMVADTIREESDVKVTVASVYNILSQLALCGIYSHRLSANNKMYFDITAAPHAHMYDCENHIFKDVAGDEILAAIEDAVSRKKFRGYKLEGVDIQFVVRPNKKKAAGARHDI
ncbi:MAG: transcriptional repressor [Bacteroidales bacterium]|nr:transcriptional repressor [Bacteroidales bacterium]